MCLFSSSSRRVAVRRTTIADARRDERDDRVRAGERGRVRAVLKPARDVHRARGVRHDIRGGRAGQRDAGAGVRPAPKHA